MSITKLNYRDLLGKRVKTLGNFVGIPKGTTGVVIDVYISDSKMIESFTVEWQGEKFKTPFGYLVDNFSLDELKFFEILKKKYERL